MNEPLAALHALPMHNHPAANGADMPITYVPLRDVEDIIEQTLFDAASRVMTVCLNRGINPTEFVAAIKDNPTITIPPAAYCNHAKQRVTQHVECPDCGLDYPLK